MLLLNKIKHSADENYDIYEEKINNYYHKYLNIYDNFLTKDLTSYIYKFYIQKNLNGVCFNDKTDICNMMQYLRKLYIVYYTFYIKDTHCILQKCIKFLMLNLYNLNW